MYLYLYDMCHGYLQANIWFDLDDMTSFVEFWTTSLDEHPYCICYTEHRYEHLLDAIEESEFPIILYLETVTITDFVGLIS